MAKQDKGKKKADEKVEKKGKSKPAETVEKKSKSKGGDEFARPSDAPAPTSDGWKFTDDDHLGDLFLITPLRLDEIDDTFHPGEKKEIVVADIVHLNEKKPGKSELHEGAWVFQGFLKGSLKGYIGTGKRVLGRLAKGDKKDRGNYPWILEDATEADAKIAREYVTFINDPLNAPKKGDSGKGKKKAKK